MRCFNWGAAELFLLLIYLLSKLQLTVTHTPLKIKKPWHWIIPKMVNNPKNPFAARTWKAWLHFTCRFNSHKYWCSERFILKKPLIGLPKYNPGSIYTSFNHHEMKSIQHWHSRLDFSFVPKDYYVVKYDSCWYFHIQWFSVTIPCHIPWVYGYNLSCCAFSFWGLLDHSNLEVQIC